MLLAASYHQPSPHGMRVRVDLLRGRDELQLPTRLAEAKHMPLSHM
jgi:hypothetical protein